MQLTKIRLYCTGQFPNKRFKIKKSVNFEPGMISQLRLSDTSDSRM